MIQKGGKLVPLWPGYSDAKVRDVMAEADKRLDAVAAVARGYCGWLLTNRAFLGEQAKLLGRHLTLLGRYRLSKLAVAGVNSAAPAVRAAPRAAHKFGQALIAFCTRWQLADLIAPGLPVPLQPQVPLTSPALATQRMRSGGVMVYLPHIFPVPSRDELREILGDALHARRSSPHLGEWMDIIASGNATKTTQIARFARLFELQHYLRILQDRHGDALHRKLTQLRGVFANFFHVGDETIDADLKLIRRAHRK
jgi:hypothetical protein